VQARSGLKGLRKRAFALWSATDLSAWKAKQSNQYIQSGRGNGEGGRDEEELRGRVRVKGWVNDGMATFTSEAGAQEEWARRFCG
jgi:hypothetical protein